MTLCSNDLLEFNFGDNTGRQERIRNIIFRNGLDATLIRSTPCSGHTYSVTGELQTFSQYDRGLNSGLIVQDKNTIILDGETDLLGNTTYWDEDETYVVTSTVSMTGVTDTKVYEYIGLFTGSETDYTTNNSYVEDITFKMMEANPTSTSTTLISAAEEEDEKIYVASTDDFNAGDYIIIEKDAVDPLYVELFQIESKTAQSITIRTPSVDKNEFSPNGLVKDHLTGSTIHLANVTEKTEITDYSIDLDAGEITIIPANFTNGSLIFFNYTYNSFSTYIEDTDYTVDYEEGVVTRITSGNIPARATVEVDYQYHHPCLDPKTGAPRRNCSSCNGFGFISSPEEDIRGLFHIPNYDSPLTQAGYWQKGDAFFTVPELSDFNDITAEPQGDDGFFVRDMIKIDNKYWLVMTKPQSFNLQNKFLGRKLHLRMISE